MYAVMKMVLCCPKVSVVHRDFFESDARTCEGSEELHLTKNKH